MTKTQEIERITAERDWWRALAEAYGFHLHGWNGLPQNGCGASFHDREMHTTMEISPKLAMAMRDMAVAGALAKPFNAFFWLTTLSDNYVSRRKSNGRSSDVGRTSGW